MASPKTEGETQKCHCGTMLVAKTKSYGKGFADKLQWQNPDGSAHYQYQANDKTYACVIPKPDEVAANQTTMDAPANATATAHPLDKIGAKPICGKINDEVQVEILNATTKIFEIEALVKWQLQITAANKGVPADVNPAKIGMYIKLLLDMGVVKK